ncbi:MAG: proteasome subunit beta, partial [Thermoplasmata archaeon]
MEESKKTGTTTVGIKFNGGVVFASERRVTAGTLIAHKSMEKTIKIDENIAITTAGLVGDAQQLARYLKAEVDLHKMRTGGPIKVKAAATLMANILAETSYFPYEVELLLGGVDSEGAHIYSIDSAGGAIEDK